MLGRDQVKGGYAMQVCWNFVLKAIRRDMFRFASHKEVSGSILRMN